MPSNNDFSLRVLVGGTVVDEYQMDGFHYIECNLNTPVSYNQTVTETIADEIETQEYPVTPYEIEVEAHELATSTCYFRILVDGVKVKGLSLEPGAKRSVRGFRDGVVIRELLFSLPRIAKNAVDRLSPERLSRVGQIEVECWSAELKSRIWKQRKNTLEFVQANKKDSANVTRGQYMMTTSKAGRAVCERRTFRCVDHWRRKSLKSRLSVFYRMGHELVEMGFALRPFILNDVKNFQHSTLCKRESDLDRGSGSGLGSQEAHSTTRILKCKSDKNSWDIHQFIDLTNDDS